MKVKDITREMWHEYPVWKLDDERKFFETVSSNSPLSLEETYIVRAIFKTVDGQEFDGYVSDIYAPYGIGIFLGAEEYGFNLSVYSLVLSELDRFKKDQSENDFYLFPLKYQTEVYFEGQDYIADVLDPKFKDFHNKKISRLQTVLDGVTKDDEEISYFQSMIENYKYNKK